MLEKREAPDAYREYVARRRDAERRRCSATGAPAPRTPVAARREPEYLTLALLLSAVEFALVSVAAAVYATATHGVGFGVLALLGAGVMAAYLTVGTVFVPAFLAAWPLLYLLRWRAARAELTPD